VSDLSLALPRPLFPLLVTCRHIPGERLLGATKGILCRTWRGRGNIGNAGVGTRRRPGGRRLASPASPSPASRAPRLPPASRGRPLRALDHSTCFMQSLHVLRMRWCSQMLSPPQSLHLLRRRWCSQMAGTFVMCCVVFIKATFGHSLGPGAVRGIAPRRGREEIVEPCGRTIVGGTRLWAGFDGLELPRERETFISRKATRSEGDDLEESAALALIRHGGRGRGGRPEGL